MHQYLVTIYALPIELCLRICQIWPIASMLAQLKWEFLPLWRELLFQLSTVPYLQGVPAIFCWHWIDINFCEELRRFYMSKQGLRTPLVVWHWLFYILSPAWLYRIHSFYFHSKKFEEKLGNADDAQMCIGVCLKGGILSIAMIWGKRGVRGGKRKCWL